LQACSDVGPTTATETGLIAAKDHLAAKSRGGKGRAAANKVVVLLTNGRPNLYSSSESEIQSYIDAHETLGEFYKNGNYWLNAPLMQASIMHDENWSLYPVGIGLGTEKDFLDRMTKVADTSDIKGESVRDSGNPAEYEQRLTEIFKKIVTHPQLRLVQ
jgi:hypothetical protein